MLESTKFIMWKKDDQMAFFFFNQSDLIAIILCIFFNIIFHIFYIYAYLHCFVFQCTHRPFASLSVIFEWIINFLPPSPKSPKSSSSLRITLILSIYLCAFVEWLKPNCGAMYLITLSWGPLITSPLAVKSVYYRRLTAWTASIIFRFYISHSAFTHARAHAIKCIVHLKCNV